MENVEQRVKKIVAEQLGVNEAEIKNESSFVDDLGADSLDTVELVMALEEEFETEIPDEEAEKITTVQQAIDYIKATSRSNPQPAAARRRPRSARSCRPCRRRASRADPRISNARTSCPTAASSSPDWASSRPSASASRRRGTTILDGALRHRADHALRRVGASRRASPAR